MNHTAISAPSRAAMVLSSPRGFSPSYGELDYRNAGATSLSLVAAGNQVLGLSCALAFIHPRHYAALFGERRKKHQQIFKQSRKYHWFVDPPSQSITRRCAVMGSKEITEKIRHN
jgi:hypothetical protein